MILFQLTLHTYVVLIAFWINLKLFDQLTVKLFQLIDKNF